MLKQKENCATNYFKLVNMPYNSLQANALITNKIANVLQVLQCATENATIVASYIKETTEKVKDNHFEHDHKDKIFEVIISLLVQIRQNAKLLRNNAQGARQSDALFEYQNRIAPTFLAAKINNIVIRVKSHNVFCTLITYEKDIYSQKILTRIISKSSGLYKMNISKKNYKANTHIVIKKFLNEIKHSILKEIPYPILSRKLLKLNLTLPYHIRQKFISHIVKMLINNNSEVIVNICEKKIFNGCRSKKKRRKKRMGLRFFV